MRNICDILGVRFEEQVKEVKGAYPMKFTMKKVLALLIATIVCLSLVACGENATEETSGTTNGKDTMPVKMMSL